ncbi:fimbrial assembly family protein [Leptolyngbya sp. NIES-3755]|nr:fimbrial assembly family protein [Leptolyngbya sp. NIES-3755]
MYSLDVNFLNDRSEIKSDKKRGGGRGKPSISPTDRRPLYLGFAALVFFPAVAAALLGILTLRNGDLEKQQADLDVQLGNLETEKKNLSKVQEEAKQATAEAEALASVFNQIKPWSAMTQDIRDRLPATIQLASITQVAPTATTPPPAGTTPVASAAPVSSRIQIQGTASSMNDVNDFMLTLQQSNFLRADQTKVVSAELGEEKTLQIPKFPGVEREVGQFKAPRLPRRVSFTITTAINDVPASELIRELDRKGAVGLVTRIEALKQRGVISETATPKSPTPAATQKDGAKTP